LFAVFGCGVFACGARAADAGLTLEQVEARVKAARGAYPAAERLVETYAQGDRVESIVEISSGGDRRVDYEVGPFRGAYGVVDGQSWSQNENGETVLDAAPSDDAANANEPHDEPSTATLSREAGAEGFYVLSDLTALGFGTRDYVDPATWHVVRRETISATEKTITRYDDFRTTNGYTRAWHTSTTDGHPENDSSFTISNITVPDFPKDAFAVPDDRRKLVEFLQGVTSVVLPLNYDRDAGKFIVRMMVGDRGLDFEIDTGASGIYITSDVARELGLKEYGKYSNAANAGRFTSTHTIVPEIAIGSLKMHDVAVDTIPDIDEGGGDRKVVGLLGFDFIDSIGLKLDYQNGIATAYDLDSFSVPAAPRMIDLKVRLSSYTPETTIAVNGAVGTHWTIDSGGAGAVLITDYFRRRFPGAAVDENGVVRPTKLEGVGGDFGANYVNLASFTIGNVTFKHYGAYVLSDARLYSGESDGIVGPDLLRLFTVYIDYNENAMRLIPNDAGSFGIQK
jgi:hypothetical protein